MIDINNLQKCSGCGACRNICAKGAISFVADASGFMYPKIDEQKCVNCSLCDTVCQMQNKSALSPKFEQKFYALVNKNDEQLKVSSSGGAFLAVATYVFNNNGVVAGCAFDENLKAHHVITYTLEECIEKLCGSKYVQSDTGSVYSEIKKLLSSGKLVLFTGTPCQVEGLYLFLKKKPDNLITIDLICHGVSSPLLWKKHKEYMESRVHAKINNFRFRGKEKVGWALYYYYYYYGGKNRCKKGPSVLDRYYTDFLKGVNYRELCYSCQYANLNRIGDLTIGDFWGAEKYFPNLDAHKGISLLLVNSSKGEQIIQLINNSVSLYETSKENAVAGNHNLIMPTTRPEHRDTYYQSALVDIEKWENDYVNTKSWKMAMLKSKIPSFIKKLLRR